MVHGGAGGVRKCGLRGEGGPAAVAGPGLHAGQHRTPPQEQGQALTTRVADPDWIRIQIGSVDPDPGSGSRRAKMTHKSRKKI